MTSTMLDTSAPPPRLSNILNTDSDENSSTSADELDLPTENDGELDSSARTKRLYAEHQIELEPGQPSKKRRKQSKPVRISALTGPTEKDSEDERDADEEGKPSVSSDIAVSPAAEELASSTDVLNETDKLTYFRETEQIHSKVQYAKDKSDSDSFSSIRTEIPIYTKVQKSDSASPLDFMVGSWMSELQNKAEESLNGTKQQIVTPPAAPGAQSPFNDRKFLESMPGYLPFGPPPFLIPIVPQGTGHNPSTQILQQLSTHGTGQSQPSIRIFNPDAYCELCNKEFCNKYFLKTHKANKHGIYVDSPSQATLSGSTVPGSPYAASFIAAAMTTPPSLILPTASQPQLAKSCPLTPQNSDLDAKVKAEGEMKSSCDVCHTKFCNRFFMRRHKIKVHGITDESIDDGSSVFPAFDSLQKQENDEPENVSESSETGSNALETIYIDPSQTEDIHQPNTQIKSNSPQADNSCQVSPNFSGTDYSVDQSIVKQESYDFEREETSANTSSNTAKKEGTFSVDRLRRLGVINADAFCEICCKEYCNKYFLRTHKMKRHGIIMNDSDSKECKLFGSGTGSRNSQTSPLNLIIGEQGTNSSDSGGKVRTELPDGDEPECDICGRKFQSVYLMQMHRAYLHGRNEAVESNKESNDGSNVLSNEEEVTPETGHLNNNNVEENENESKNNISADLQKLQTMISQLNNLNMVKITTCTICNKDLENGFFFKAHMMNDHGILVQDNSEVMNEKQQFLGDNSPPPTPASPSETFCNICKKDYFSKYFLKQHMDEFHGSGSQPLLTTNVSFEREQVKEEIESKETQEKVTNQIFSPLSSEKRVSLTPTSSYCEICNKELCNKYFMKTHMQRMHGIEIENGAQIGGVICDICNKELCSKYFLRVHKQNTHGIVEDASNRDGSAVTTNGGININFLSPENDQALKASEFTDLNNRYFTHFTEVCNFCNRRFRSPKWLKAHLLNDHGEAGIGKWKELEQRYQLQQSKQSTNKSGGGIIQNQQGLSNHSPTLKIPSAWSSQEHTFEPSEQGGETRSQQVLSSLFGAGESSGKSYHCFYCSFSTPVLAFLFVHERSHTGTSTQTIPDPSKPFQCPVCLQSFLQIDIFQHHIMTHQLSGLLNPFFSSNTSTSPSQVVTSPSSYTVAPPTSSSSLRSGENSPNYQTQQEPKEQQESDKDIPATVERYPSTPNGAKNKFRCSRCFQRFRTRELCQLHVRNKHGNKTGEINVSPMIENVNNQGDYHGSNKCMWCGFTSPHAGIMKKHIKKEHRVASTQQDIHLKEDSSESWKETKVVISEDVKKKLQEAVRKCQIPASYAVPQNRPSSNGAFIMQPFLVEEPSSMHASRGQLVPALVFLPVREKLSEPMTVSVTLTPT